LPKAAKHASRIHCCAQLSRDGEDSDKLVLKVEIIGQNGMLVQGAKKEKGEAYITVGEGEHVVLGFYSGYELTIVCSAEAQEPKNNRRECQAISAHPTSEATMPLSSDFTPMEDLLSDEGEEEEEEEEELVRPPTKRLRVTDSLSSVRSRSSSAAPSPYSHQEDDGYPPSDSSSDEGMDQDTDAKKAGASDFKHWLSMFSDALWHRGIASLAETSQTSCFRAQTRYNRLSRLGSRLPAARNAHYK